MEVAISAVAGEILSRFISLLVKRYSERAPLDNNKEERLQQLLLRVHTVVEEADGRYITNGGMLRQLKTIAETMYQGYHVLDTFKCSQLKDGAEKEVRDNSSALSLAAHLKRPRKTAPTANRTKPIDHELQTAVEDMEVAVANMTEFVVLLGGCERMTRRPYDTYLYHDNFMFGRHAEKQRLINILLQHNPPGPPVVLPVIGGRVVGKKTLVAHVCSDERVRTHFSSVLHLSGGNFGEIVDHEKPMSGRTLAVVEFVSDVHEKDWERFYSYMSSMCRGSKVIIISRLEKLVRFGTVKPIHLNRLSDEELSYLFKTLAFGSANPVDHPSLVSMIREFEPQLGGSIVGVYTVADVLRKNVNLQFWLCIMEMCRSIVQRNFELFGEHPKTLFGRDHPVEIAYAAADAPLQLLPYRSATNVSERELPKVTFGDLIGDPTLRPKGDFKLVMWESKIPPYNMSVHFVPACVDDKPKTFFLSGMKRRGHGMMP